MKKETILKLYYADSVSVEIPDNIVKKGKELQQKMIQCQERMKAMIPEKHLDEFRRMCGMHCLMDSETMEEIYVQGFMTGMRLAVEALYENDSADHFH